MRNAAQAWFSGGSINEEVLGQSSSSSILADSYAAVKIANDKVTGGFSLFSKGAKDLSGSFHSATSNLPSGKDPGPIRIGLGCLSNNHLKGFRYVASGPMVRSSYKAGEYYIKSMIDADRSTSSSALPVS